ncbi:MAG: site-2 protease family protein [Pseudomonadales bacterium]|nr:site-2 protease family protein [Pseudomonadales bacterium]
MLIQLLFSNPAAFILIAVALVISLSIHEFAHAWTADKLGDPTARSQGRVTLNPLAHLDLLGTILIFFIGFGWGKPVPFDPYNLKKPLRDSALIALAGPVSNLLLAGGLSVLLHVFGSGTGLGSQIFEVFATLTIFYNVMLAVFNLIPVYPLDGSKVLLPLLPESIAHEYEQFMSRYGNIILLALIFPWNGSSAVSQLISPIIDAITGVLIG